MLREEKRQTENIERNEREDKTQVREGKEEEKLQ